MAKMTENVENDNNYDEMNPNEIVEIFRRNSPGPSRGP